MRLIYCAGGNKRFADIAIKHGFAYGAQLPSTVYNPIQFADQNWKNPNFDMYMNALDTHRPMMATVLDYDDNATFENVMMWADKASEFVTETIIIIPKISGTIDSIPHCINGKRVVLGYSVPTKFGATDVPLWEFGRRPVHLLGGSPHRQHELAGYLNVVSTDGNYSQKMAVERNQFFANGSATWAKNRYFPKLNESLYGHIDNDAPYFAFELSCMNINAMWQGCNVMVRYAMEGDLIAIKKIANQYRNELGYVMMPALRESIARQTLLVACYGERIVGFVNYRACRDGWQTIYEIAVDKNCHGQNIGKGLLASVPKPIRLKTTIDNERANGFYMTNGFELVGTEQGRKRPLNVYHQVTI